MHIVTMGTSLETAGKNILLVIFSRLWVWGKL